MNMKLDKKAKSVIAIYSIIFVLYTICFLVVPFTKILASWISFAFTLVALISSLFVCYKAFNNTETIISKIYGFPIFKVGALYAIIQFVLGIVICVVGAFVSVPYWIALVVSLILLAVAAIGVIITDNARDIVEGIEDNTKEAIKSVTIFQINIAGIVDACADEALKAELTKLNEEFCYSDPVSSDQTKAKEDEINTMLEELKVYVERSDVTMASEQAKKISNTLAERNRICKAFK